jgi:hypothetical protein
MVPALGRDDRLPDLGQQPLALRQGQAESREGAQITGADDLQHVNAQDRSPNPGFHQTQNPPHP